MVLWRLRFFVIFQGSKLTPTNLQNVSDFDNLQARTKSTSKPLRVRIIHVSQTFGESCSNSHQFASGKILLTKLHKWTKKLTLSPDLYTDEYRATCFEYALYMIFIREMYMYSSRFTSIYSLGNNTCTN